MRRLAALAAEESERAEEEASLVYVWGSVVEKEIERPRCAVCFSPTTTRCSRCKAVRYWLVYSEIYRFCFVYFVYFFFFGEF